MRTAHGWDSVYAWNNEVFGIPQPSPRPSPSGRGSKNDELVDLGRANERDIVLPHYLKDAILRLNAGLPETALQDAYQKLTRHDVARSVLQHNREFYKYLRNGVPVTYRDADGGLETQVLLDGMLAKDKLLDLLENFILFDDSRAGGTRKIVARNQQVLGVNNAVDAVSKQQALKNR